MGEVLGKNITALSILSDLMRRNVISLHEKERIIIEFQEAGVIFSVITLAERNLLMEYVNKYSSMNNEEREFHAKHLQDVYIMRNGNDKLKFSWWRIQKYADECNRQMVAVVHALMAAYVEA